MKRRKYIDPWREELKHTANRLNRPGADRLRRWFSEWISSGRDLERAPELRKELNSLLSGRFHLGVMRRSIEDMDTADPELPPGSVAVPWPTLPPAEPHLVLWAPPDNASIAEQVIEFLLFFIGNPHAQDLGTCARENCGQYFVMTRKRLKYCSPRCSRHAAAVKAMREGYQRKTDERLRKAEGAIKLFGKRKAWPTDWKQQVADAVGDVRPNWVSRQVNQGRLQGPPSKRQKAQKHK